MQRRKRKGHMLKSVRKTCSPVTSHFCTQIVLCAIMLGSEDYAAELDRRRNVLSVNLTWPQAANHSVWQWEKRTSTNIELLPCTMWCNTIYVSLQPWEMGVSSPLCMWKDWGQKRDMTCFNRTWNQQAAGVCKPVCKHGAWCSERPDCQHLGIFNNFISTCEFYEWSLTGQWCTLQELEVPEPCELPCPITSLSAWGVPGLLLPDSDSQLLSLPVSTP